MKPPRATTVATVDPEIAPNSPQARTPAMPSPPGSQLTRALANLMSFSTMDPAVMMFPQRIKNSTTTRAKLSILLSRVWASSRIGISVKKRNPSTEVKNKHMNTGI